jgi:hypothetical protein
MVNGGLVVEDEGHERIGLVIGQMNSTSPR